MTKTKVCSKCKKRKYKKSFTKDKYQKDGLTYDCSICRRIKNKEYHMKNPGLKKKNNDSRKEYRKEYYSRPETKRKHKSDYLKRKYGITIEEFDKMYEMQKGLCKICVQPERTVRNRTLAVDHCHKTGIIRGLLCSHCNRALGLLGDDVNLLKIAYNYLKESQNE